MRHALLLMVGVLATAAVLSAAPATKAGPKSPYASPDLDPGRSQRRPMFCQNRACQDPNTCGIFTQGRMCTVDGFENCDEQACP